MFGIEALFKANGPAAIKAPVTAPTPARDPALDILNAQLADAISANAELVAENAALKNALIVDEQFVDGLRFAVAAAGAATRKLEEERNTLFARVQELEEIVGNADRAIDGAIKAIDAAAEALGFDLGDDEGEDEAPCGPDCTCQPENGVEIIGWEAVPEEDRAELAEVIRAQIAELQAQGGVVNQVRVTPV